MASPAQKIFEADSESLYDFVSKNGRGLYIPPYQRDYAWDKANVERLIDDTVQGLGALLKRPDESITFIGTIIAMHDAKKLTISPLVKNQVYSQVMTIIDGQQRLTTLLMLCLALLIEIETEWASLIKAKTIVSDETKNWIETRVNDMRGLLSQMLSEEQRNGEAEFRHFPKMIRAFKDTWSYESDKANYDSPIAWMLFEYVKFSKQDNPNWSKFLVELQKTSVGADNEAERKHFVKMMKVMRTKLKALPSDDEFPDFANIVNDTEKQDALFGEEFPEPMTLALTQILAKQSHALMVDEAGDLEIEADDKKTQEWWQSATSLISLLFFSRFALERITLVVVTATTEDFAFDVFEALNTTGQPLTALETFTPKVVQSIGLQHYNVSEEKKQLDVAFSYLKKATNAEARQKRSAELLIAFALAERGEKQSKNLADQRRFMRDTFDGCGSAVAQKSFVRHLADLSRFFDEVWVDGIPAVGTTKLPADAALCIRFLVALGHTITAPLLAQYAAAITAAGQDTELKKIAVAEFAAVARAVTSFAVLWRSSRSTTDRIEQVYRDLMSKGAPEHGVGPLARGLRNDRVLPKADVIKQVLAARLKTDRTNGGANIGSKEEWIEKTVVQPIYFVNVALARFLLMTAFHDTVEGPDGILIAGKAGSHPTLTIEAWTTDLYTSVEHIAPQSQGDWPADLYADDEYDRLGNLTLVPLNANQSLSARTWLHKKKFFAALAADTTQEAELILAELKGMGADVSKVAGRIHGEHYLPHVKAIAAFPHEWNLQAVDARGRLLAELAWNRLAPWLGM